MLSPDEACDNDRPWHTECHCVTGVCEIGPEIERRWHSMSTTGLDSLKSPNQHGAASGPMPPSPRPPARQEKSPNRDLSKSP